MEWPYILTGLDRRVLVLPVAASLYGVAALIAGLAGFGEVFLRSPAFALGSVGVAWSHLSLRDRARLADNLYTDLHRLFTVPRIFYVAIIKQRFDKLCDARSHMIVAGLLWSVFVTLTVFAYRPGRQGQAHIWAFDARMFTGNAVAIKFALVVFFALLMAIVLGTILFLVVGEIVLVRDLARLPAVPIPELVRTGLRTLADYHVLLARDWTMGVIFFIALFWPNADLRSILAVVVVLVFGLFTFGAPQISLSRLVRAAHERSCQVAYEYWQEQYRSPVVNPQKSVEYLASLAEITARPKFWVYSADELWRWIFGQVLAVGALTLQAYSTLRGGG